MSSKTSDARQPFLGALMRHSWQWVWKQIVSGVLAAGYDDITAAHIGMFRHPSLEGQRPSELADQLQITKQSVNDLLGHLEGAGYINSTGIAVIVGLLARARAAGIEVRAYGLTAHYREIFEITRLADFMAINPDEDSAVSGAEGSRDA